MTFQLYGGFLIPGLKSGAFRPHFVKNVKNVNITHIINPLNNAQQQCTTTMAPTLIAPTLIAPTLIALNQGNIIQLNLVYNQYTEILNKKSGVFIVSVHKNDGPCKMFNIAKTEPMANAVINYTLKIDKSNCTIDLKWDADEYIQVKINNSDSTYDGLYTINWI